MALYKFKVLRGRYNEAGKTYGKGLPAGDTVLTSKDLRKFDRHGMPVKKFMLVETLEGKASEEATAAPAVPTPEPKVDEDLAETFRSMSVPELRQYAAGEEIDLGDATRKDDIVKALIAATQPV